MHYVGGVFYYKWSVDVILLTLYSNLLYQVSEAEMRKSVYRETTVKNAQLLVRQRSISGFLLIR